MRLVTLLLLIQLGYIIAKAVETPLSCNDSLENDPRMKRSDKIDIDSEITDKTKKGPEDSSTRKKIFQLNNENDDDLGESDNDNEKTNEFTSNPNTLPQKFPLVSNVTEFPDNIEKGDNVPIKLTTKDAPLEKTEYYKAIDPQHLYISGLSLPKANKNVTNISKTGEPTPLVESKTALLNDENTTKVMNVSNKDESNDNVGNGKEIAINDRYTDITNIRELREHLLDHLLDYFINIIKEEELIRNNTRKNNDNDRMKVEEKLRNYYDPHHLDMLIVDDDDYYDNNKLDYHGNDSEEDLLDNVEELNGENVTNFYAFNTLADEIDENASKTHKSSEDLQELPLNLEENLKSSSPDGVSFNITLPESVTPEYINLIEEDNDLRITLSNTTEKPEDAYDSNISVTTTAESSFSNEALNVRTAEIYTEPLNYSEEVTTDKTGNVYDNGALILDDFTSYEDYIDSDEIQVTKNVTVHAHEINSIVDTKENGRRKNGLDKEITIENATLDETKKETNAEILTNNKMNTDSKHDKIKKVANIDQPNKNTDDDTPCKEENLSETKNKNSSKKPKHGEDQEASSYPVTKLRRSDRQSVHVKYWYSAASALSIIFTKQIETRPLNETNNIAKNQKYFQNNTLVNKTDVSDRNGTVPMKELYSQQRVYHTNHEPKHVNEFRNRYIIEQMLNEDAEADKLKTEKPSKNSHKSNKIISLPKELTPLDKRNHLSNEEKYIEEDGQEDLIDKNVLKTMVLKTVIEKVKKELSETNYKLNDESLKNAAKKHLSGNPVPRLKNVSTRHHNTNIHTTQAMTENSLITEIDNGKSKIKHRKNKNHKSSRKLENNIYDHDEFKIASKHDNKLKYICNNNHNSLSRENKQYELKHVDDTAEVWVSRQSNSEYTPKYKRHFQKRKHQDDIVTRDNHRDKTKQNSKIKRDLETTKTNQQHKYKPAVKRKDEDERTLDSGETLNSNEGSTQTLQRHDNKRLKTLIRENRSSKVKHRHNKKSDTMSLENEIYRLKKHLNDMKVNKLNKPKHSLNYQKKKYGKIANKNKHIGKTKNKSEKVISNIHKRNLKNKKHFISNRHTNIIREDKGIFASKDKLNATVHNYDEKNTTPDSCEEQLKQNEIDKMPSLPFYISTTTLARKDKKEAKTLLDDLNTVLNEKKNLNKDLLNQTIDRLVSSKIVDFITDKLAGQMLMKLQKSLLPEHQFKAKTEEVEQTDKVEQIGILFKNNGEMQVMMSRENDTETEIKNQSDDDIEEFYLA